jgi:probable addiction module antidote protein
MAIKTYPVDIAAELKTEEDIEGFIEASIEEAKNDIDPKYLIHALETAARARGMLTTAVETEVDRANLYRILSGETDSRVSTLDKIASALGYRLTLVKQPVDIKNMATAI